MFNIRTYRDSLINFHKNIYYDKNKQGWIITNNHLSEDILKNPYFSSNSLQTKLKNSNLSLNEIKIAKNFYDSWLIYCDNEKHNSSRYIIKSYLDDSLKKLDNNVIKQIIYKHINSLYKSETINLVSMANNICREIMAEIFGISETDYNDLINISRPITNFLYDSKITKSNFIKADDSLKKYNLQLQNIISNKNFSKNSILYKMWENNDVSIGLMINILIDGQDPFESAMKSVMYLWSQGMTTKFSSDLKNIFSVIAPFTYVSRIAIDDYKIGNFTIHKGDRVLCIISEQSNMQSAHHGSLAFGKGIHRCLGEPLVMKSIRLMYEVLNEFNCKFIFNNYKTNNEFGYFTFTDINVKVIQKEIKR